MQRENDVFILYKKNIVNWFQAFTSRDVLTSQCFEIFYCGILSHFHWIVCIVRYTSELIYCWCVDNGFDGFPSLKSKSTFLCFVRAREVETYVMWILTHIYLLFSVRNRNFQVYFLLLQKVKTFLVHIIGKVSLWYMRFCFQLE